ncbi:putative protein tyrosine phosphatase [Trypanosoma cruzi Dm28c]|uniref:Uncharacterized protein n=1 Tax=Trypanosoma cruzi Dm28c TaxID=1416333 RepID=V5AVY0_TRYCR|nr:putative protein tyrosine phosphatase [Trypanosoma cruzi Dm28c]
MAPKGGNADESIATCFRLRLFFLVGLLISSCGSGVSLSCVQEFAFFFFYRNRHTRTLLYSSCSFLRFFPSFYFHHFLLRLFGGTTFIIAVYF